MAEDEIPALEDMTTLLNQVQRLLDMKDRKQPERGSEPRVSDTLLAHSQTISDNAGSKVDESSSQKSQISSGNFYKIETTDMASKSTKFGGMKKGFLFGSSQPTDIKSKSTDVSRKHDGDKGSLEDSTPFLKSRPEKKELELKFTEVQEAMDSAQGFLGNKDWVTEDLLEKVQKNDALAKQMCDPHFMQAITDLQTNPEAAMAKYQSNKDMQVFLKEFCGLLGQHFIELGEKQNVADNTTHYQGKGRPGPVVSELTDQSPPPGRPHKAGALAADPQVEKILSDPVNVEILTDPSVQKLLQSLRSNPEAAQRMLCEGDDSFRGKVDRLISLGLIRFQA